jgi:hypothetical protein
MVAAISVPAAVAHYLLGDSQAPIGYVAHFVVIISAALLAGGAAVALTVVGAQRGEGRIVVVGMAFTAMAGLLGLHGLATEDVLVGEHEGVMALAGGAALPVAGAILALSALPSLARPGDVRWLLWLNAGILVAIATVGAIGLSDPAAVPEVPAAGSPESLAALAAGAGFFGVVVVRAARTYRLTRRRADLAVACGVLALTAALGLQLLFSAWTWGWWLGHAFEFAGIGLVGVPVAFDIHRAAQSRPLIGDLRGAELVAQEEAYLGVHVRALLVRLAEKDPYTEGHTRRVARLAVEVGEAMGLPPETLRELAIGGLVHDVGKLAVDDRILKKPEPLDDREYSVIKRHPQWGEELLEELGGFSEQVRTLVRHHHERLDGRGYPDGLTGGEIDLATRVLTVCDVYDALVTTRVYREAWTHRQAFTLLEEEAGIAFEPRCVAALERVIAGEGESVTLWPAAQPDFSSTSAGTSAYAS